MTSCTLLLQLVIAVLSSNVVYGTVNQVPLPTIDLTEWWGPTNAQCESCINDFTITFDPEVIQDFKYRLKRHRSFRPPLDGVAFQYGFNSTVLEEWITYVLEEYPFEEREEYLNRYEHHMTCIQGLNIHFMRIRSKSSKCKVIPLLMLHGWPGSVREFYETIPHLISLGEEQGIAFDIIVPSLPGYGFSDAAVRPGLGVDKLAIVFSNLMHRLGYEKYYCQGGDLGSLIVVIMATFFPEEVSGVHLNLVFTHTPETLFHLIMGSLHTQEVTSADTVDRIYPLTSQFVGLMSEAGYLHIQSTRPDTVGIGLSDSPAGLMAYILEKIATFSRKKAPYYPDGLLSEVLPKVSIIDNLMIYWITNSITTSMRLYADTYNKRCYGQRLNEIRTPVPLCAIQPKDELMYLPTWLIKKKFPNILRSTAPSEGGHFYAWEKPELFAEDVVKAVVAFREWHAMNSTMYSQCLSYIDE